MNPLSQEPRALDPPMSEGPADAGRRTRHAR